jgi:hypothetical protein
MRWPKKIHRQDGHAIRKHVWNQASGTQYLSPLMANDHPEMDMSELLDEDGIHQYQSLIGGLQWTISLGRFDMATAIMTMSGFHVAPRAGHLERLK